MARYTTQVKSICETMAGYTEPAGFGDIESILTTAAPLVFSFDFPIFDESYRAALERKILRHYYTREICEESVGLWKLRLDARLNEIMPYYNKLYLSELLDFNPFYDVDLTTTHEGKGSSDTDTAGESSTGETTGETIGYANKDVKTETGSRTLDRETSNKGTKTTSGTSSSEESHKDTDWDYYSDTPQGGVSGLTSLAYLTNAREDTNSGSSEQSGSTSGSESTSGSGTLGDTEKTAGEYTLNRNSDTEKAGTKNANTSTSGTANVVTTDQYIEKVVGKRGAASYSSLLLEFRKTLLNIDMMVIEDLKDLFFGLWE